MQIENNRYKSKKEYYQLKAGKYKDKAIIMEKTLELSKYKQMVKEKQQFAEIKN